MRLILQQGDCVEHLKSLEKNSVSYILCDPPYGIDFKVTHKLGKVTEFDRLSSIEEFHKTWLQEAFRVLKPNGIIRAFAANRTCHRLVLALSKVGFKDIDISMWAYTSGRPKSVDLSKSITALDLTGSAYQGRFYMLTHGKEREKKVGDWTRGKFFDSSIKREELNFELSENGKTWKGWQNMLKPSFEPIVVGRK